MAGDVVAYSQMMQSDEAATLAKLHNFRAEIFEPQLALHEADVIKRMGDGWLVEFPSIGEAVCCAIDIQTAAEQIGALKLRIGVHLGEVVCDQEDIFGDGVNIASRLQTASEPGGILISDIAFRSIDGRLRKLFLSAGQRSFKNFSEPIKVFNWRGTQESHAPSVSPIESDPTIKIGVLPFDNLNAKSDQEFFADGITEEIITTLAKLPDTMVVGRNSTFVYKGRSVDIKTVGLEQGVDLVLEGSVRRHGDTVRITAQLIDAKTGMHVWADRYDRRIEDVFDVQDEIALRIATEFQVELLDGEMARFRGAGTRNMRAWDAQLKALRCARKITKESIAEARRLAALAHSIDPAYSAPLCTLGFAHTVEARHGFAVDRTGALASARDCAQRALALEPYNPEAYGVLGFSDAIEGDLARAILHFQTALEQNPNHADVAARLSLTYSFNGQFAEAIRTAKNAITLNPHYPGWYAGVLGFAYRLAGNYAEAIPFFLQYSRMVEGFGHLDLVITHALAGNMAASKDEARNVLRHRPDFTVSDWAKTQLFADAGFLERDRAALIEAGLPK
jgi:adenylate cyclase